MYGYLNVKTLLKCQELLQDLCVCVCVCVRASGRTVWETGVGLKDGVGDLGIRRGGVDYTSGVVYSFGSIGLPLFSMGTVVPIFIPPCLHLSLVITPPQSVFSSTGTLGQLVILQCSNPSLSPPALSALSPSLPTPFHSGNEACLGPAHSHQQFQRHCK